MRSYAPATPRLPVLIGVVLALASTARGESAEELYREAFGAITFDDSEPLREAVADDGPLSPEAVAMVDANARAIELAVRAADAEFGGWPLDRSRGFAAELPWLNDGRELATLLAAGARLAAERGDPASAADRLIAALRLGRRIGTSGVVVEELVEVGAAERTVDAARRVLPALGEAELRRLRGPTREALAGVDMKQAFRGEHEMMRALFRRAADLPAEESVGALTAALTLEVSFAQFACHPVTRTWLDPQGRAELLDGYERAHAASIDIFDVPSGDERDRRQADLDRRLDADEFGWLAGVTVPKAAVGADVESRGRARLAMLLAAVAYRLDDEAGLRDVPDPATGEAFDLREEPGGGFTLVSGLEVDGEPVTLSVPAFAGG